MTDADLHATIDRHRQHNPGAVPDLIRFAAEIDRLREELALAMGGMAAQDRREAEAGEKCGVHAYLHGCDWPDGVADVVLRLRAVVDARRKVLATIKTYADTNFATATDQHSKFVLGTIANMVSQCVDTERTCEVREGA